MADSPTVNYSASYLEESQQPRIIAICSVFIALSTIAVALRVISRYISKSLWKLDDTFFTISYVFFIAWCGTVLADVKYAGIGLHEARVMQDPSKIPLWGKFTIADEYMYITAVTAPKIAVLHMYLCIFGQSSRSFRIACYATGTIVALNFVANVAAGFASCIPLKYLWGGSKTGECFNFNEWYRWVRIISIICDVAVIVLPIPLTLRLKISTRQKFGLLLAFMMGGIGLVAVIVTIVVMWTHDVQSDNTWSGGIILFWGTIEAGMYLISPCVISYPALWKWFRRRVLKKELNTLPSYGVGDSNRSDRYTRKDDLNDTIALCDIEDGGSATRSSQSIR